MNDVQASNTKNASTWDAAAAAACEESKRTTGIMI